MNEAAERRSRRRLLRPSLPAGSKVGRYEIVEELGQGGMGVVYRAHDADLGRDVAIKVVTTGETTSETLATRLMREAQALAQLSHPNVVAVYDVGRLPGGVFVAMELIAGVSGDVWLRERPSWRRVLAVFRDAGRGLAAAHRSGLVHRDFKPANLMIGSDGRVRVLDFGLARASTTVTASGELVSAPGDDLPALPSDEGEVSTTAALGRGEPDTLPPRATPTPAPRPAEANAPAAPLPRTGSAGERSTPTLLDTPLTQIGAIVGTPPYMAPEQHLGAGCDARTDQFSFCVAFYQALYGERPFHGDNYAELSENIVKGRIRAQPLRTRVPGWLRAIVLRGLEVVPEKRWPSMDAILEALDQDPDARRRRWMGAGAGLLLMAVTGGVAWRGLRAPSCGGAERALFSVWDEPRKQAVQRAFAATHLPYAQDAFAAVQRALDGYTGAWVAMQADACEATNVRHTQSAELFDLRMQCLGQRLDDVRAQVELLVSADADVVARAAEATRALPALDGCADATLLRAPVRPPAEPDTRARVAATRKTLATVRALFEGGRYKDARQRLQPALAEARAIGWRPLEAEALLMAGHVEEATGEYAPAGRDYRDAAVAAEAGRADDDAARAAIGLVWVTGDRLGKYAEARELARDAQAKIERLGRAELIAADLEAKLATLAADEGKYPEALERSRRVLETRRKLLRSDDPAIASTVGDVADELTQLGRFDEAISAYKEALTLAERAVGPAHPLCGSLHINLGAALRESGRPGEALAEYRRAQAIVEATQGREHPTLATLAINIGGVLLDEGKPTEAAPQFERALALWQKTLGPEHPNVATAHFRLGQVALALDRPQAAQGEFARSLAIWQKALGPTHPSLSAAWDGLGDALLAQGKAVEAEADYRRALALLEPAVGPRHPDLAEALTGIGRAALAAGAPRRALPALERALQVRTVAQGASEAADVARTKFALARALDGAGGDRARARTLASEARATLVAAGRGHDHEADEIENWLKKR